MQQRIMLSILDKENFDQLNQFAYNFGTVVEKEIRIMFNEKNTQDLMTKYNV